MVGTRARGIIEVCRPVNAIVAGLLTFIGAYIAGGITAFPIHTTAAVLATLCATAAGNAVNDYFDRDIDRINAPQRPIPRGAITPTTALAVGVVLFVIAVVLALTLPAVAIAIAIVNLLGLVTYTKFLKGTPGAGNATVAYLGGSTFLFGGAAVHNIGPTVVLFLLASLTTFTREVIKDVEDIEGDVTEGLRTLPIAIGRANALHVGTVVLLVAVIVSPLPYLIHLFGVWYLISVIPGVILMILASYIGYTNPTRSQRLLKTGMVIAALAFIIGRFTA